MRVVKLLLLDQPKPLPSLQRVDLKGLPRRRQKSRPSHTEDSVRCLSPTCSQSTAAQTGPRSIPLPAHEPSARWSIGLALPRSIQIPPATNCPHHAAAAERFHSRSIPATPLRYAQPRCFFAADE